MAAAVSVAFVAWGVADTGSLATASGKALSWVLDNTGWLFVLAASGFVVFVIWLALSRYGAIPLGRDDEGAGVPHGVVGRDDVQRRHGHRTDVLRRERAHPALHRGPAESPGATTASALPRRRWRRRCSTGRCTRGRSTPWSGSRSPTASTARAGSS
ncbi:BCCT family transporter [Nocardioides sp. TF02-7]|nr:BCCT family transporter [Nocardioides sp. TF02-7]